MKKIRYILWILGGVVSILAGCAFMDLVWSNLISREDLARSKTIKDVETCREMSHLSFRTWLIFNPKGYRTYYIRSECFQKMAVRNRDEELCRDVVERKTLYFDGSAVSEKACLEAVRRQKTLDRQAGLPGVVHRIATVTVSRIPRSDTADVRVTTEGSLPGIYSLTFGLLDDQGRYAGPLDAVETRLGSSRAGRLETMIERRDVQRLLGPRFRTGTPYTLEVRLELVRSAEQILPQEKETPPPPASILHKVVLFD